jgi:hypothetical protein
MPNKHYLPVNHSTEVFCPTDEPHWPKRGGLARARRADDCAVTAL